MAQIKNRQVRRIALAKHLRPPRRGWVVRSLRSQKKFLSMRGMQNVTDPSLVPDIVAVRRLPDGRQLLVDAHGRPFGSSAGATPSHEAGNCSSRRSLAPR